MKRTHKYWNETEISFIKNNLQYSDRILGEKLGRTASSVDGLRIRKNIIRPKEQWHFQKGNVPANLGQKMSKEKYRKCYPTMFKKGGIPPTTKYFGKPYIITRIRNNGYKEKTWFIQAGCKRRHYLAFLCEQYGINLKGKVPRLKPEYNYNMVPEIEDVVIISRAENMKLNSYQKYPKPLRRLIQVAGALSRQINKNL
jgi:hypothetical protein